MLLRALSNVFSTLSGKSLISCSFPPLLAQLIRLTPLGNAQCHDGGSQPFAHQHELQEVQTSWVCWRSPVPVLFFKVGITLISPLIIFRLFIKEIYIKNVHFSVKLWKVVSQLWSSFSLKAGIANEKCSSKLCRKAFCTWLTLAAHILAPFQITYRLSSAPNLAFTPENLLPNPWEDWGCLQKAAGYG